MVTRQTTQQPRDKLAWQCAAASLVLNILGMPLEAFLERAVPSMPHWVSWASVGFSALLLVMMLAASKELTAAQSSWVFVLNNLAIASELFFTSGYFARSSLVWPPFQANKLGVLAVALLAPPGSWPGVTSIALLSGSALIRFWTFPLEVQARLRLSEPWAMLAFTVFGVGLLLFRLRSRSLREEVSRAHAETVVLERLAERQRQESNHLREEVQTRDTFLSIASHELKTPLTPLALRLQLLAKATEAQQDSEFIRQVRSHLYAASRQLRQLTDLVEDLLDTTRISTGHLRLKIEEVDVAATLREVTGRFQENAAQRGVPITLEAPEHLSTQSARLRLEQVISNLLDNALKYGQGGPVEVRLAREGEHAVLSVTDHGIGIAPENLSRIFERFERAVSEQAYAGLGLGLYITRSIVEQLGGTIEVQSQLGKGSTFTVRLPLKGPPLL
jgi:signal transduction histidine kinase